MFRTEALDHQRAAAAMWAMSVVWVQKDRPTAVIFQRYAARRSSAARDCVDIDRKRRAPYTLPAAERDAALARMDSEVKG